MTVRSFGLAGMVALLALTGADAGEPSSEAPKPRETEVPLIERLLDRWRDFSGPLISLSREERVARVPEFFRDVSLDQIRQLCRECSEDDKKTVRELMRAKFEFDPPAQADYVSLVGDTTLIGDCWMAAARAAVRLGDELEPSVARAISDTLLFQADRPSVSDPWKRQLEHTAAQIGVSDRLYRRMVEHLDSHHDSLRISGVLMARGSRDPRAADLLVRQIERAVSDSVEYAASYPATVLGAAAIAGAASLPAIERVLIGDDSLERKRHAIMALGSVRHPATLPLLLRVYDDEKSGIRDSTAVIPPGPERTRYAALHFVARSLEAYLIEELRSGPAEDARRAFELVDRASRYGPLVEPWNITAALKDFALRDLGIDGRRVQSVVERVKNPPDPNWILREQRRAGETGTAP